MKGFKIIEGDRKIESSDGWSAANHLDIALFSDIHIPGSDTSREDQQIRKNFILSLDHAMQSNPRVIVISGDLGQHEGCVDSYTWIRDTLDKNSVPYFIIPGNHDHNFLIEQIFPDFSLKDGKLFYYVQFASWSFIFLDSSPDSVSNNQIVWMKNLLALAPSDTLWALVLHHPPIQCDCIYMDRHYPLTNNASLLEILDSTDKIKHVFCGHYHTSKMLQFNRNIQLHLTPSTWFQIDEIEPEFTISDKRIGYRRISIDGKSLNTSVIMLNPA